MRPRATRPLEWKPLPEARTDLEMISREQTQALRMLVEVLREGLDLEVAIEEHRALERLAPARDEER